VYKRQDLYRAPLIAEPFIDEKKTEMEIICGDGMSENL
jgi:hypothetical protein